MPKILKAEGIETDSIGSNGNNYFDLQRNRSTLVRLSTSDLVGIGTTTPAYKFTVQSSSGTSAQIGILSESQTVDNGSEMTMDLRNTAGFFSGGSIRVRHTVGSQTAGNESTYMSFLTRGAGSLTERMRIDNDGDVGIGITNPLVKLHVNGSTRIGSGNDYQFDSTLKINGESTGATGYIRFYVDSTERLRIDANGNVGLGTNSPTTILDVYSATLASQIIRGDSTTDLTIHRASSDTVRPNLIFRKSRGSQASPSAVASGDNLGGVLFQAFGGTNNRTIAGLAGFVDTYTSDTDISSFLTLTTTPAGSTIALERLRIVPDGKVGIGTSSPAYTLDVSGSAEAAGNFNSTGDTYIGISRSGTRNILLQASSTAGLLYQEANLPLVIGTNNTERLRITSDGNVGIGTSSPGTKLHVDSASAAHYARFNSTAANGGYLTIESSGTVHGDIGTAAQLVSGGSASDFGINARGSRNLVFGTNNTERLRIESNGNIEFRSSITETSQNAFTTSIGGAVTIDVTSGTIYLGQTTSSISSWSFTNVDVSNSRCATVTVIIAGNASYTYGDPCNVNGSAVSGGVRWVNATAPVATANTDIITFSIVRDSGGTVRVFGFSTTNLS